MHVVVHVTPHQHFERDGNDVYCAIPISITQATLGAEVLVPTLDGKRVKLKVTPGTQSGKMLRLKGEGVSVLNGGNRRGDMYVKLQVNIPKSVSSRGRELLRELAALEGENHSPDPIPLSELSSQRS